MYDLMIRRAFWAISSLFAPALPVALWAWSFGGARPREVLAAFFLMPAAITSFQADVLLPEGMEYIAAAFVYTLAISFKARFHGPWAIVGVLFFSTANCALFLLAALLRG